MVTRGCVHDLGAASGFVATLKGRGVLATYRLAADDCEIFSLESLREGQRTRTALLAAVADAARGRLQAPLANHH
jgi:hypothetical protein